MAVCHARTILVGAGGHRQIEYELVVKQQLCNFAFRWNGREALLSGKTAGYKLTPSTGKTHASHGKGA